MFALKTWHNLLFHQINKREAMLELCMPLRTKSSVRISPESKCRLMRSSFQLSNNGLSTFNIFYEKRIDKSSAFTSLVTAPVDM